ncbi:MAG: hypothetical protein HKN85_11335 [Gammaproteobacteria bacterium]|nr:hypothetical protein [Gammaproteobacteria bacterium]
MKTISIREIQGSELHSPLAGKTVKTHGLVTGVLRRGFFLQTPNIVWDGQGSDAVFVYTSDWLPERGAMLEVVGEVIDYLKHETAKPVTQIHLDRARIRPDRDAQGVAFRVEPIQFSRGFLEQDNQALACQLNSLEGMLIRIAAGQTFIAPSNSHGDYVLALDADGDDDSMLRSEHLGALISPDNPQRWYPGFRVANYNHAQRLNVGARLTADICGPLHYRADSYQLSVSDPFKIEPAFVGLPKSTLTPTAGSVTIMTLNCFNLDPHIESASLVTNPRQDVDDDWGDGRFHTLAQAVVLQANTPDIIALQEIQDSDGAELTERVEATRTYQLLVNTIEELSGIKYRWANVNPQLGADGGQPGGNIRNGYLYNPDRVSEVEGSVRVFGEHEAYFEGSRKPLLALFQEHHSNKVLACINLHLASKRHQNSIFAPDQPGFDCKLAVRVAQARRVQQETALLREKGLAYYVTGDFNDTEHSETLRTLIGKHSVNLVETLAENERYDYNHRGKLQVLMHGIVDREMTSATAQYEIIHGNELIGVQPGEDSDKPSDHAYVLAKLQLH